MALTISVATEACRSGELPAGPVLLTTYLRTAETGSYVPLIRDVDAQHRERAGYCGGDAGLRADGLTA